MKHELYRIYYEGECQSIAEFSRLLDKSENDGTKALNHTTSPWPTGNREAMGVLRKGFEHSWEVEMRPKMSPERPPAAALGPCDCMLVRHAAP